MKPLTLFLFLLMIGCSPSEPKVEIIGSPEIKPRYHITLAEPYREYSVPTVNVRQTPDGCAIEYNDGKTPTLYLHGKVLVEMEK
jgi:hypothetical protein